MTLDARDRLVFGIGRIHHLHFRSTRRRLLKRALELGFRTFDVAPAYGNGLAETELGQVLRESAISVSINTKVGIPIRIYPTIAANTFPVARAIDTLVGGHRNAYSTRDFSPVAIRESLEGSLRRLRRERVETLFLHEPLQAIPSQELLEISETMNDLIRQGKLATWGIAGPRSRYAGGDLYLDRRLSWQQPLSEWLLESSGTRISNAILYGTFQAFVADGRCDSFPAYLEGIALQHPELRFLVATNRVDRIPAFLN